MLPVDSNSESNSPWGRKLKLSTVQPPFLSEDGLTGGMSGLGILSTIPVRVQLYRKTIHYTRNGIIKKIILYIGSIGYSLGI